MARVKGQVITSTYDASVSRPLDARMLVSSKEDLITPSCWTPLNVNSQTCYKGMIVSVAGDGVYYLKGNKSDITTENLNAYQVAKEKNEDTTMYFSMWEKLCNISELDSLSNRISELEKAEPGTFEGITQDQLDSAIAALQEEIANAGYITAEQLPDISGKLDIATYEEDKKSFLTSIPDDYITSEELANEGFLKEHQDISGKADIIHTHTVEDITDMPEYALKTELPSLENLATITQLDTKADKATTYTKTEVDNKLTEISSGGNINLDGYVSEDEWTDRVAAFALKSDIPSLDGYATEQFVTEAVENITIPDTSNFITNEELENKGYLTEHQDISGKADKSEIPHNVSDLANDACYTTLEEVAKEGYATESYVNEKVASIQPGQGNVDLTGYATEEWVSNQGYLKSDDLSDYITKDQIDELIPNTSDFITMEDINKQGFLTTIPDTYVTEEELQDAISNIKIPEVPSISLEGYATQEWVQEQNYLTEHQDISGKVDKSELADYATKAELNSATASHANFINRGELNTAVSNLNNTLATKANNYLFSNIFLVNRQVGGYGVGDKIGPTTSIVEILTKLLDLQPFQEPVEPTKYTVNFSVNNTVYTSGKYIEGETIEFPSDPTLDGYTFKYWYIGNYIQVTPGYTMPGNDITIYAFFEKNAEPDEPSIKETASLEDIKNDSLPVMQGSVKDGEWVQNNTSSTYGTLSLTKDTYANAPENKDANTSLFYEVIDNGAVTESGYQVYSFAGSRGSKYRIAIPAGITLSGVKFWDTLTSSWLPYDPTFTLVESIEANGYIYNIYESSDRCNEQIFRFILM